jgi:predicted nucleic acid-binding protein
LGGCHWIEQPARLWEEAGDLGFYLARRGVTVKTLDLLIAAHALAQGMALLARDADFERMRRAGVALLLHPR